MGSWAEEDLLQGSGWWTQRDGGSWSGVSKGKAAAGGPGDRPHNPEFQHGEIKPQTTE